MTTWGLVSTNENTVGFEEIVDGSTLSQKLRIREDLEEVTRLAVDTHIKETEQE